MRLAVPQTTLATGAVCLTDFPSISASATTFTAPVQGSALSAATSINVAAVWLEPKVGSEFGVMRSEPPLDEVLVDPEVGAVLQFEFGHGDSSFARLIGHHRWQPLPSF